MPNLQSLIQLHSLFFKRALAEEMIAVCPPRNVLSQFLWPRADPPRLTVMEDSVDLLSSDLALRCGDKGDVDTSRMEPGAVSAAKSCRKYASHRVTHGWVEPKQLFPNIFALGRHIKTPRSISGNEAALMNSLKA